MPDTLQHDNGALPWRAIVWDYEAQETAIIGSDNNGGGEIVPIAIVHDDSRQLWLLRAAGQLLAAASAVVISADDTGCDGVTVVDSKALEALEAALDAAAGPEPTANPAN